MFGGIISVIGLVALSVAVLVVLASRPARGPVPLPVGDPGLARLRRVAVGARLVGLLAGAAVLIPLGYLGRLGQGLVLIPAVLATVQVLGVLVAELSTRRDARRPGSAGVEVRRLRDYLPRSLAVTAVLTGLVLSAAVAWTTAAASPDDLGRAGRAMAYRCTTADCDEGAFGPWPGSFYTLPLIVGLALMIMLAAVTLVVTVRRPRDGAELAVVVVDDAIRRQSVASVLAAGLFGFAGSLVGIGLVAGPALLVHAGDGPAEFLPMGVGLTAAGVAGLGALCWAAAVLLRPLLRPAVVEAAPLTAGIAPLSADTAR